MEYERYFGGREAPRNRSSAPGHLVTAGKALNTEIGDVFEFEAVLMHGGWFLS